jgi:hypothetical protein
MHRGRRLHADRVAPHLQRDLIAAVRNLWDNRSLIPPSKVLVKIVIERHGRKASGTGRGPPIHRGRRRLAERLATFNATRSVLYATYGTTEA